MATHSTGRIGYHFWPVHANTWTKNSDTHTVANLQDLISAFVGIIRSTTRIKLNCYKSLVRPILEYTAVVWAPHTLSTITSIEKIQRYATRFICSDYLRYSSVTEMLQSLSLPTLSQCRDIAKVIFLYKILHQVVDVSVPDCYYSSFMEHLWSPIKVYTTTD